MLWLISFRLCMWEVTISLLLRKKRLTSWSIFDEKGLSPLVQIFFLYFSKIMIFLLKHKKKWIWVLEKSFFFENNHGYLEIMKRQKKFHIWREIF